MRWSYSVSIQLLLLFVLITFLSSCSIRKAAVNMSSVVVDEVEASFFLEEDLEIAKAAIPSIAKIAEGMQSLYPKSPYYSGKLCFLYTAYAFVYIDEESIKVCFNTY